MGASIVGGGLSFGSTHKDDDCNRRLYARQLHAMGYRVAAIALQCMAPEVQQAMALAGTPCPQQRVAVAPIKGTAVVSAYASASVQTRYSNYTHGDSSWVSPAEMAPYGGR
jgi:hypothetical protein